MADKPFFAALQEYLNSLSGIDGVLEFNAAPPGSASPWYTMVPIADPEGRLLFCPPNQGEMTVQFNCYSNDRYGGYISLDNIKDIVKATRGDIGYNYSVWRTMWTGVSAFGTENIQIQQFTFDGVFSWEEIL